MAGHSVGVRESEGVFEGFLWALLHGWAESKMTLLLVMDTGNALASRWMEYFWGAAQG